MNSDAMAAIFVPICLFGLPVAAIIFSRYLRHQERMEMLRRGIVPPPDMSRRAYREWRRAGGTWPPPGSPPPQAQPYVQPPPTVAWTAVEDDPQRALMKGIRLALIGLGLTMAFGYAFGGYRGNPILLGGLIPMFVGVAQIIIAMLSGAQLPGAEPRMTFIPPPQPPPGNTSTPPPPNFGSTVTPPPWARPAGPHLEELSRPAPPPDLR
jgi:hypothetical protein